VSKEKEEKMYYAEQANFLVTKDSQKNWPNLYSSRVEAKESLDFFPTPPWATRALLRELPKRGHILKTQTVWEPACGFGDMVRPLQEEFKEVFGSDIHDYTSDYPILDFLTATKHVDWIITNPPFNKALAFAKHGIEQTRTALFVRQAFLETKARYQELFANAPPDVYQFVERVPLYKGKLDRHGTVLATSYIWCVWDEYSEGRIRWIPPSRKALELDADYV
jgi:hypothetical protein